MKVKHFIVVLCLFCLTGCAGNVENLLLADDEETREILEIDDLASFGEFNATEFVSRNERSISDGFVTEYYSSADFDEVVSHYKKVLENAEDYDITEYPGSFTQISAYVGDVFVQFGIQKDEDEETYIVFQYEDTASVGSESGEVNGLTGEAFKESIDTYIESTIGTDDIITRNQISKLDYDKWKKDWDDYYPKNLTVMIEGKGSGYDFVDNNGEHHDGEYHYSYSNACYFKDKDFHIENTFIGEVTRTTVIIYNSDVNKTFILGEDGARVTENGNSAPIRLLDLSYFEAFESASEDTDAYFDLGLEVLLDDYFITEYIEKKNGERYMIASFYTNNGRTYNAGSFTYSFDDRIIISYKEHGTELEYCDHHLEGMPMFYVDEWQVTKINREQRIDDALFNSDNY